MWASVANASALVFEESQVGLKMKMKMKGTPAGRQSNKTLKTLFNLRRRRVRGLSPTAM
jgi:hypothetical protein